MMSDDEGVLCCCEYINFKGEKSHLLATCCDCDVLDESFDKLITGRPISSESSRLLTIVIKDRIRIPWISGKGAVKVNLDVALPILLMPVFVLLAAYNIFMSVVMFCTLALIFLAIFCQRLRFLPRTNFFQTWMIVSIFFLLYVFEALVVSFREILMVENFIWVILFLGMVYFLHKCKQDPGILVTSSNQQYESRNDAQVIPLAPSLGEEFSDKCNFCNVWRTPRAVHCQTCGLCIRRRDHHCVWLNTCIGQKNHRSFLLALIFVILASCYGAHLTLTTVCVPEQIWDYFLIPLDCRYVFFDYKVALCFNSAIYSILIAALTSFTLLQQILLISQNLTITEWRRAMEAHRLRHCCVVSDNPYNSGLWRNWANFLRSIGK